MSRSFISILCFTLIVVQAGLVPQTNDEHKARILDLPISQQQHFTDLSQDNKIEHNSEYDHEAFLGVDDAKTFDKLSPIESKKRLEILVDKIDKDHDGYVTKVELKDWIKLIQTRYITEDVNRQWHQINNDTDEFITWQEYDNATYYALYDSHPDDEKTTEHYLRLQKKDRRRFNKADLNLDGKLNKEEFADFTHPENAPRMKELVITETIEDIDKNGDGLLSIEEYIGDMWNSEKGLEEPEWIKNERENYKKYRDLNHDQYMDREEIEKWLMPSDYDHVEAESSHLIREVDANKDNQLSKNEILNKYEIFVGSQVTDWGDALQHEEF
ncbi:unnamed protein product [Didymodactylos carnosus]|uniref:Reticulocalbin-3 n=1 Tax=Didymodactylos carnosus TaxID=1234261 RepID=A0A814IV97_9BILA|nr:unnamed protein product [Didymodactylos carnosus]CAF1321748.1 unnamed protein product [Didymodactylos carnosus]CAF3798712.1 unnamed protein product [Didymodactylos carnosus]CAF4131895.1 unnamed protein product [Didymodactylos carnosus]